MDSYRYSAYGLTIESELHCPELPALAPGAETDVTIRMGHVPERLEAATEVVHWMQVVDGAFQIEIPQIARYRVERAREIIVDPLPDSTLAEVRLFLLGTVLGALLHQRGRPPLHASTVCVDGRAFAFCGHSGAGKSTLAAALHRRGFPLLSDDTGVVRPDARGRPVYHPGVPRIRLWRDALDHFDIATSGLVRDSLRADKFHLQPAESSVGGASVLAGIYFLSTAPDDGVAIDPVITRERIPLLMAHTYRPQLARRLGSTADLFRHCAWIVREVPLRRFFRPWSLAQLDSAVDQLEADIRRGTQ